MTSQASEYDAKGLIREAYRIEGIGPSECRAIFFDWAVGLPADVDPVSAIEALLTCYEPPEDHPMTALLRAALARPPATGRRAGRRGRRGRV